MLPFGVTIPATVPQGAEIPEGLMNHPVYNILSQLCFYVTKVTEYSEKIKVVKFPPRNFYSDPGYVFQYWFLILFYILKNGFVNMD
jgi:hypothetical protein